jgi:hypothetical protein
MTHEDNAVFTISTLHDDPNLGKIRITEEMTYQP